MHMPMNMTRPPLLCVALYLTCGGFAQPSFPFFDFDVVLGREDSAFMAQVQVKADRWVHEKYATVYDGLHGFRKPLSNQERLAIDAEEHRYEGSWRVLLHLSPAYDTLTVLGFPPNVYAPQRDDQQLDLWMEGERLANLLRQTGKGAKDYLTLWLRDKLLVHPGYILPLSEYGNFLGSDDLLRLGAIVEEQLGTLADVRYSVHGHPVRSYAWKWFDHPGWMLAGQYEMPRSFIDCFDRLPTLRMRSDPHDDAFLTPEMASGLLWGTDMVMTDTGEEVDLEVLKRTDAIELAFDMARIDRACDHHGLRGFASYKVSCDQVGLRFEGEPHGSMWLGKDDFVACSGNPLLRGWIDAIFANEIAKRLHGH